MSETVWVSVNSHRARSRLKSLLELGPSYGVWPVGGGWPSGEYYQIPAEATSRLAGIKGLRVLKGEPRGRLFKRWT